MDLYIFGKNADLSEWDNAIKNYKKERSKNLETLILSERLLLNPIFNPFKKSTFPISLNQNTFDVEEVNKQEQTESIEKVIYI